jgi:hypothetical protein
MKMILIHHTSDFFYSLMSEMGVGGRREGAMAMTMGTLFTIKNFFSASNEVNTKIIISNASERRILSEANNGVGKQEQRRSSIDKL